LQQPGGDFVGDQRGKREGVVGYLKVRSGRRNGQGVKGFEEGSNSGRFRFPGREERTGEEGADVWAPSVGEREREGLYRFGLFARWATGQKSGWAERLPRV
jgi:hypothetical protein